MEVEVTKHGEVVCVHPKNERLDAAEAIEFKSRLGQVVEAGNINILINMEKVEFVDSSGLGAIISALRAVGVKGDVKLCNVSEQVITLLSLTRLDKVLEVFSSEETGLASFE